MDRSIQQYQVLHDEDIFNVYQEYHQDFIKTAGLTEAYKQTNNQYALLAQLIQDELTLYHHVVNTHTLLEELTADDMHGYSLLRSTAKQLIKQGHQQIREESELLFKLAESTDKKVKYSAIISVFLACFVGFLLLFFINKPIRRVGRAIHQLGRTEFEKPIVIEGSKDLREIGDQLEWLRLKLIQLENSQQLFIKSISHELKTPLATLVEGVDLLRAEVVGELNAEQFKIIELLQIANIRLHGLIENLLEYQEITSTEAELNLFQFDIIQLIKQMYEDYQLLLKNKVVSLEAKEKSIDFIADQDKMKIVISNLLSNAIKFSPDGGRINIKLEVVGSDLCLLIEDQGVGISESQRFHIFNEFYKHSSSKKERIKGSGLGLHLVKYYVTAHHGQIELLPASEEYSGARFQLTLPQLPQ
jgi:two-component system sensor histidine kinase GlrK